MTSLLIGCGNLGKIILEGFSKKKKKIIVLEKNIKVSKEIKKKFSHVECFSDPKKVNWIKVNYIMLCVKPNDSKKVVSEIKNSYNVNEFFMARIPNYKVYACVYKLFESINITDPSTETDARFTIITPQVVCDFDSHNILLTLNHVCP